MATKWPILFKVGKIRYKILSPAEGLHAVVNCRTDEEIGSLDGATVSFNHLKSAARDLVQS